MEFVKKLKPFDYCIILILIIGFIIGCLTFSGLRQTSSKQIDKTTKVEMEIYLRGVAVTSNEPVFKADDETFITIRNVPYTKLKINAVSFDRRKQVISANNPNGFLVVEDVSVRLHVDFREEVPEIMRVDFFIFWEIRSL